MRFTKGFLSSVHMNAGHTITLSNLLTKYYQHDLCTPGAFKVTVGGTLAQIWCLYLNYLCRGVDLTIFFSLNPVLGISAFKCNCKKDRWCYWGGWWVDFGWN